jgi:hypothetical protein
MGGTGWAWAGVWSSFTVFMGFIALGLSSSTTPEYVWAGARGQLRLFGSSCSTSVMGMFARLMLGEFLSTTPGQPQDCYTCL